MIVRSSARYGRASVNRLAGATAPGIDGARALVESFYYAFNHRDMGVFRTLWADDALVQLNNPLGGMLRGHAAVEDLYRRVFDGPARVWVEFDDIVEYQTGEMVTFAGRETGVFTRGDVAVPLAIRTTRVIQWLGAAHGWRQVHHHGSIDDPGALDRYQRAVHGIDAAN